MTTRFAGVPIPLGILALGALALVMGFSWALFAAGAFRFSKKLPAAWRPWAAAALYAGLEAFFAHFTPRLGGDLMSYTQVRWLAVLQSTALLGPHVIGFLLMAWGCALAEVVSLRDRMRLRNLAWAGLLLVLNVAYGSVILAGRAEPKQDGPTVAILQPNIDQYVKWNDAHTADIRRTFEALIAAAAGADLIVWPESSLPGWLQDPEEQAWLGGLARAAKAPMLVGALARVGGARHNAAVLLDAGGALGAYYKRQLVPFGEFVPLRAWLQPWIGILAQMGDFTSGAREQPLLSTPLGTVAASICYEAVFPHLLRRDAARGARIFVNLTNDGWYKDTGGPTQHFYTNMFRAIENRVTVIRSGNTGISAVIDPYGVITARTRIGERTQLTVRLPKDDPFPRGSLFARWGDLFGFAAMGAALWLLGKAR